MKKVVIRGKKKADIEEVQTPSAKGNWALVKIMVAPMCTEYKSYNSGEECECLGHEAAGEVVEVAHPGPVKAGDRVVVMPQYPCLKCELCLAGEYIHCENIVDINEYTGSPEGAETYAQYILKPSALLPKIPDHISYEHAGMLCCGLGPSFGAMQRIGVDSFDTVLVTGLGPVGLGGIINGVFRGARVIGVSRNEYRSGLAMDLGADQIINPDEKKAVEQIRELTEGRGVDAAIECAGDESAQKLCIDSTRRNGNVAFVGESGALNVQVSDQLIRNGLTLHGIWHYNLNDIPKLFQIVEECSGLLDKMITHKFPFDKVEEAWQLQTTRQCGKVLLYPWE